MPSGIAGRSMTAPRGVERSWSRHRDLITGEDIKEDVRARHWAGRRDKRWELFRLQDNLKQSATALRFTDSILSRARLKETLKDYSEQVTGKEEKSQQRKHLWSPERDRMGSELDGKEDLQQYSLSLVETGRIRLVLELRFLMAIVSWDRKNERKKQRSWGVRHTTIKWVNMSSSTNNTSPPSGHQCFCQWS